MPERTEAEALEENSAAIETATTEIALEDAQEVPAETPEEEKKPIDLKSILGFDIETTKVQIHEAKLLFYMKYLGADINEKNELPYSWLLDNLSSYDVDKDYVLTAAFKRPEHNEFFMPGTALSVHPTFIRFFDPTKVTLHDWANQRSGSIPRYWDEISNVEDRSKLHIIFPRTGAARHSYQLPKGNYLYDFVNCQAWFSQEELDKAIPFFLANDGELTLKFMVEDLDEIPEQQILGYYMAPNVIYIVPKILSRVEYINEKHVQLMTHIFECFQHILSQPEDKIRSYVDNISRVRLNKALSAVFKQSFRTAVQRYDTLHRDIARMTTNLSTMVREYDHLKVVVDCSEAFIEGKIKQTFTEIEKLKESPKVLDVQLLPDGTMRVRLDKIPIMPPPREEVEKHVSAETRRTITRRHGGEAAVRIGGPYTVTIGLINNFVKIMSDNPCRNGYWSPSQAPHVDSSGSPCWGNASEPVHELLSKHEYAFLVDYLINFLGTVNVDDAAGRKWYNWPVHTT